MIHHLRNTLVLLAALAAAGALGADTLSRNVTVHLKPDSSTPSIGTLESGKVVTYAEQAGLPAGWRAVSLDGPTEGFIANDDIDKNLDPKPGTSLRTAPRADAPVLAVMGDDEKAEVIGLSGDFTKIRIQRGITVYIQPEGAPKPAVIPPLPVGQQPPTVAPTNPPVADPGALPRSFEGVFVRARHLLKAPPQEYQLVNASGERIAYVDLANLMITDPTESFIDHQVVIQGTARRIEGSADLVIVAETMQLR